VKVKTRPAEGQYEARNEVAGFKAIAGGMAPDQPAWRARPAMAPAFQKAFGDFLALGDTASQVKRQKRREQAGKQRPKRGQYFC
jgi:hypothetical protein